MASEYITRINTLTGEKQIDYNALANLPDDNKFTHVVVGETTLTAASGSDAVKFTAGDNVNLNVDATNKEITIGAEVYDIKAGEDVTVDVDDVNKQVTINARSYKFTAGENVSLTTSTNEMTKEITIDAEVYGIEAGENVSLDVDHDAKKITVNAEVVKLKAGNNVSLDTNESTKEITINTELHSFTEGNNVSLGVNGKEITINAELHTFTAGNNVSLDTDGKNITINANVPEIPPATVVATITGDSTSGYTSDKNFSVLSTAINDGAAVIIKYGDYRFQLAEASSTTLKFNTTTGLVHKVFSISSGNAITYSETTAVDAANNIQAVVHIGTTAPTNTKLLWIDTTATTGGLKYHNGSAWAHVPVAYN